MIKRTLLALLFFAVLLTSKTGAQGLTAPAEGKAVIYFARVSSYGALIPFDFFDGNRFIGDFAGKKYLRYECDPGEHLFWASSENKAFMTAQVEAGNAYVVVVDVVMGIGIARVGLSPISSTDKVFPRAKELIGKKAPVTMSEDKIRSENERLAGFIQEKLSQYESKWKNELTIKHLSPEMAIDSDHGFQVPPISH
jgi:hypothetical protein